MRRRLDVEPGNAIAMQGRARVAAHDARPKVGHLGAWCSLLRCSMEHHPPDAGASFFGRVELPAAVVHGRHMVGCRLDRLDLARFVPRQQRAALHDLVHVVSGYVEVRHGVQATELDRGYVVGLSCFFLSGCTKIQQILLRSSYMCQMVRYVSTLEDVIDGNILLVHSLGNQGRFLLQSTISDLITFGVVLV